MRPWADPPTEHQNCSAMLKDRRLLQYRVATTVLNLSCTTISGALMGIIYLQCPRDSYCIRLVIQNVLFRGCCCVGGPCRTMRSQPRRTSDCGQGKVALSLFAACFAVSAVGVTMSRAVRSFDGDRKGRKAADNNRFDAVSCTNSRILFKSQVLTDCSFDYCPKC